MPPQEDPAPVAALEEVFSQARSDEDLANDETITQPAALKVTLKRYQLIGVAWMDSQEDGSNKGGILADDMGLGKTVQSLALILTRPPPNRLPTLIAVPTNVLKQWEREIATITPSLRVIVVHGDFKRRAQGDWRTISGYDIILTTHGMLTSERTAMSAAASTEAQLFYGTNCFFHRVILDEAHDFRNPLTAKAKAAYALSATYRWALTGTPIQNKVEDFQSLLAFCHITPYSDLDLFKNEIAKPLKKAKFSGPSMVKLQDLDRGTTLRRLAKSTLAGEPVLSLPPKETKDVLVYFDRHEEIYYRDFENLIRTSLTKFHDYGDIKIDKVEYMLVRLLRLRQACLHPYLTMTHQQINTADNALLNAQELPQAAVDRLLQHEQWLCQVCQETTGNLSITPCGHAICNPDLIVWKDHCADNLNCPFCREPFNMQKVTNRLSLLKAHDEGNAAIQGFEEAESARAMVVDQRFPSAKIKKTVEILREVKQAGVGKTTIFSFFPSYLDLLAEELNQHDDFKNYLRYDSSVKIAERDRIVTKFTEEPDWNILLIGMKTGGTGLNLMARNHVIMSEPYWNPFVDRQAEGRSHRIGQQNPVTVYRLRLAAPEGFVAVDDNGYTVEDRIRKLQQRKIRVAEQALSEEGGQEISDFGLGLEEIRFLLMGGELP